jgi:hypothetical protein
VYITGVVGVCLLWVLRSVPGRGLCDRPITRPGSPMESMECTCVILCDVLAVYIYIHIYVCIYTARTSHIMTNLRSIYIYIYIYIHTHTHTHTHYKDISKLNNFFLGPPSSYLTNVGLMGYCCVWPHIMTHLHSIGLPGRVIGLSQRPLPATLHNTYKRHNPTTPVRFKPARLLCLIPRGHWDQE